MGRGANEFVGLVRECYAHDHAATTGRVSFRVPSEQRGRVAEVVHTIVPVHDGRDKVDGIVIYTENVTEREEQGQAAGVEEE